MKGTEEEIAQLYTRHTFNIDAGQEPMRIDKFLVNRVEGITRNKVQNAINKNQVMVNGFPVKVSYKLKPSDVIEVLVDKDPDEYQIIPQDIPLDIIFEDDYLMIINKPPGMVVHPGVGNYTDTLLNALAFRFQTSLTVNDKRPWLVHRIDKNTSGLLVVAKDDITLNGLAKQFKDHTTRRTYNALVWGNLDEPTGTISTFIGRDQYDRKRFTVHETEENAKWAVTHYKVLRDYHYATFLECNLETGRTHQIRVHFKHLGHPLFNDEKYGGNKILKGVVFSRYKQFIDNCFHIMPRHALHAKSIGFKHPITGEEMDFHSDLPPDFATVIEKWEAVSASQQF